MSVTRQSKWIAYAAETHWASGHAGAADKGHDAYADGEGQAALDKMAGCNWGALTYDREPQFDLGGGAATLAATPSTILTSKSPTRNPAFKGMKAQTSTLLLAVSNAANQALGQLGADFMSTGKQSWCLLGSNGLLDYQAFGCVPKQYTLTIAAGEPVLQDCEFVHYTTETAAIALTAVAFNTAAVKYSKDCTVTVAGQATGIRSIRVTVDFKYGADGDGDVDVGSGLRDTPTLTGVDFTVDLEFTNSTLAAALDGDLQAETPTDRDISIVIPFAALSKTWSINDLVVTEMNDTEADSEAITVYKATLKPGTGFDQAVA
jgi:hypothetical protein